MPEPIKDNVILYDINTYTYPSWSNEINKDENAYVKYQKNHNYNYISKFGSWVKNLFKLGNNENTLKFIFASSKPWNQWKLTISESGSFAVLKENMIEYYENLDTILWRVEIDNKYLRISNIFFNKQADMLVYTNEYGNIHFFDSLDGTEQFKYEETKISEFESSICKIFFIDRETIDLSNFDDDILELMMTLTYSGHFNVFTINKHKSINKIYSHSLLNLIPNGIYCAEVDFKLEYLIIGSFASNSSFKQNSTGIFIFRILNTEPWIKLVKLSNENKSRIDSNKLNDKNFTKINFSKIEYVTKLEISPDNTSLAAIYVSGKIDIYSLPSLNLLHEWFMTEQPMYNELNSDIVENPFELKRFKQIYHESDFRVVDIGWWNKNVLIFTRGTGLLSLASADDLTNLMGRNLQWLNPFPSIYPYSENEFLILDCSCVLSTQSSNYDSENLLSNEDDNLSQTLNESSEITNNLDEDNEDDEDESWLTYITHGIKSQAYNLIGIERFKIPPKRPKFLRRKFSILHIKSTTPEELFQRKLNLEEYGVALQLAKTYGLDTDLVYQKQWRTKPISKSTITDYLSKIKKRSWILHECEERISENIDTTKNLIEFGLHGTDLDSLIAINETDDNKFFYSQTETDDLDDDEPFDKFNPLLVRKRKEKLQEIKNLKLKKINVQNLTLMQKELCLTRHKLLNYMDRLYVYEKILGGTIKAVELFDPEKYKDIRSKSIFEVTLDYAREGNANAVEILFSFYYDELKNKQLEIFSNFPETLEPDDYSKLLPIIQNGQVKVFDERDEIRDDKDWIESAEFRQIINHTNEILNENDSSDFYTLDKIQEWYLNRTIEIENLSGLVDLALNFAELAKANGCKNMNDLIENLKTLHTLTYECKSLKQDTEQISYNLEYISNLSDLEKLCLIMQYSNDSSNDLYIKNLQDGLLPFVLRRPTLQQRENLLKEYLLKISKEDLIPCLKLFNLKLKLKQTSNSTSVLSISNLLSEINLISIFVDCFYINEKPEQIDLCNKLISDILNASNRVETIPNQPKDRLILTNQQQAQIKQVQENLKACELFKKYGVSKTLSFIRDSCKTVDLCQDALVKLTWFASKRSDHLKINEWIELMKDLNYLQSNLYKGLIDYKDCMEIFLTSLLGSRNLENIKLAADWLKDIYIVDKEAAVKLAIKSSQEYFNASSNYTDPDMNFAKACLNLVQSLILDSKAINQPSLNENQIQQFKTQRIALNQFKTDPIIESCVKMIDYEFDLIMSMKLIADFDYNILPVQVRLSENRFEIIKDILKKNENSYKNYDRLIELAGLLHVADSHDNSELPEVVLLIAEHALNKKNLNILGQMCSNLIRLNYEPAWLCVYKLALLMCFNLVEQHKIEVNIPHNFVFNEKQTLFINPKEKFMFSSLNEHKFNFKTTFGSSKEKTVQNLIEIENLLSFVVTCCDIDCIEEVLSQKKFIENTRSKLELEDFVLDMEIKEAKYFNCENQGCNYFDELNKNDIIDLDFFNKKNLKLKKILSKLNYLKTDNQSDNQTFGYFVNLISCLTNLEANIAFAYLLELDENELSSLFDKDKYLRFDSSKAYEFLLYLFSLNLIGGLLDDDLVNKSLIYDVEPSILNEFVTNRKVIFEKREETSLKLFQKINKLSTEYNQKNQLEKLNAGIDLDRFEKDEVYKEETILGLSMDLSTFKLACSLAKFYSFDLWKVYMSFTEYLLCENESIGLTLDQVEDNLRPLIDTLKQNMSEYKKNMDERVLDYIDGKNLDKLVTYYTILNDQESEIHVKNLKQLKIAELNNLFNYKDMLQRPFEIIEPFLDDSNLQLFSKIIQKLPNKNLNPSKLHVVWCLKKFWTKINDLIKSNNEQDIWLNSENLNLIYDNFESLDESIKKLDLETDFIFFVKELSLNKKSCTILNNHIRKDLLKRINKLIKLNKLDQNEKFDTVNKELIKIQNHLKLMENVEKLFSSSNIKYERNRRIQEQLDIELGKFLIENENQNENFDEEKTKILESILTNMFFDGYKIEILNQLINLFEISSKTSVKKLIKLCLNKLCDSLKNKKETKENLDKLNILLETISNYLSLTSDSMNKNTKSNKKHSNDINSQKIIKDEDVMECMRSFCNDQQIDINIRLLILEELKKIIKTMKDEDLMLLLVYKTNAILENCDFFDKKIDQIEASLIENEEKRAKFIMKLIDLSLEKSHYLALLNLVKIWPKFTESIENPLIIILTKIIDKKIQFVELINEVKDDKNLTLNEQEMKEIKDKLINESDWDESSGLIKISFLKICLLFKTSSTNDFIKKFIVYSLRLECFEVLSSNNMDIIDTNPSFELLTNDKELMDLVIKDNFYMEILNTNFYFLFTYYLIRNETKENLHEIVKCLKKGGYLVEAAKLFTETENFYSSYRSLSVSLALIEKFNH